MILLLVILLSPLTIFAGNNDDDEVREGTYEKNIQFQDVNHIPKMNVYLIQIAHG